MDLQIQFQYDVPESEAKKLGWLLQCKPTELQRELEEQLSLCGKAALEEYLEMFLGKDVPSKTSAVYAHRLCLMIKNGFCKTIPDQDYISELFQTSARGGTTLMRNAASRYHYELEPVILTLVHQLLNDAEFPDENPDSDHKEFTTNNPVLVEYMNELVATINAEHPRSPDRTDLSPITKIKEIAAKYKIPNETLSKLSARVIDRLQTFPEATTTTPVGSASSQSSL